MRMPTDAHGTEDVMEGTLSACSPYLLAAQLGVTLTELAQLAGISRTTLAAKSAAGRRVETALRRIVRILDVAAELAGDESRYLVQASLVARLGRQDGL